VELERLIRAVRLGAWVVVLAGPAPVSFFSWIYEIYHPRPRSFGDGIPTSDLDVLLRFATYGAGASAVATYCTLPWVPRLVAPYRRPALVSAGALVFALCAVVTSKLMGWPVDGLLTRTAPGSLLWGLLADRRLFFTELPVDRPRASTRRIAGAGMVLLRGLRDVLGACERYVVVVVAGTSVFLLLSLMFGSRAFEVLPRLGSPARPQDLRDGAGWVGMWAVFAAGSGLGPAFVTLVSVRLFEWSRLPRLSTCIAGGCIAAFLTFAFVSPRHGSVVLTPLAGAVAIALAFYFGARAAPRRPGPSSAEPLRARRAIASCAILPVLAFLLYPTAMRRGLGMQTDTLEVSGVLKRDGAPLAFVRVRDSKLNSCAGEFAEVTTDESGRFRFERRLRQSEFPKGGWCRHEMRICYESSEGWERLDALDPSGVCGGHAKIDLDCDVRRSNVSVICGRRD
jgi:hypothetical protein